MTRRIHSVWFLPTREEVEKTVALIKRFFGNKNAPYIIPPRMPTALTLDVRLGRKYCCLVASCDADGADLTDLHDFFAIMANRAPWDVTDRLPPWVREMRVVKTVRVGFRRLG
ncbi:MAG: hypothetical protein QXT14_07520 [Candidatus Bathyarchaeia archaeon]